MNKKLKKLMIKGNFVVSVVVVMLVLIMGSYNEFVAEKPVILSSSAPSESSAKNSDGDRILVSLEYVYDGDTMKALVGSKTEKIRFIGVDTPEREEPFYEEAKVFTRRMLKDAKVEIEICKAERRDKHGRLLAWIYADGVSVAEELLKAGLAKTLSIPPCGLRFKDKYKNLERKAKAEKIGLWR